MICQLPLTASPSAQDRRLACAQLVLQWKGGFAPVPGGVERIDLKAQDIVRQIFIKHTPVHNDPHFFLRMEIQPCTMLLLQV